jgi:hypothetical protein
MNSGSNTITMKIVSTAVITVCVSISLYGQVVNTATLDTSDFRFQGKVTVEAYIDVYFAYNFNRPETKNQPYFVSMARDREVNINLAYIDVKYSSSRLRARFVPGFGTYINSNYRKENGTLKNIVEASAGFKVVPDRNIWIDAGVFGSPYTNESAISKDHLAYTRSFAPEYVPYYLTGVKASIPLSDKVTSYFYLLNGWQQIQDENERLAMGTQLEYRPNKNLLLNWDTYIGDERSASDSTNATRYFSDLYLIYSKGKFAATSCIYAGLQLQAQSRKAFWWQANLIVRYDLTAKTSVTGRLEHFSDPHQVQVVPVTDATRFAASSGSLGLNYKLATNVLLRIEGRTFLSEQPAYIRNGEFVRTSNTLTASVAMWF